MSSAGAIVPEPAITSDHASLARNVLSNWTVTALAIVSTFIITPIVVGVLQKEQYGVWSFLNGLLVYSDLLYLGLGSALIKSVAESQATSDRAALNRTASVVLSIYLVLGLICLGTFAGLSPLVPRFFAHPLAGGAAAAATTTCVLLGVQLLFSFVGSAFAGVLVGLDRMDLVNLVRIVSIAGRSIAVILLLGGPGALVTMAGITCATTAIEAVGVAALAFSIDRKLSLKPTIPTRRELRFLYGFGVQSFFIIFAVTLISYTDTTVIAVALGASSVALYSLPQQLVDYVRVAAAGASGVLLPRLTVLSTRGDVGGLRTAYIKVSRFTLFIASFIVGNVLFLGAPFLRLWVGPEFGDQVQWVIVFLSFSTLLHIFVITAPLGFYQAMNTLSVPALVLLIEAVANLALSLFLAPRLGITGVALGTLIPAAIIGCFVLAPFLWKKLEVPASAIRRILVPSAVLLLVTCVVQWVLGRLAGDTSYAMLAAKTALTVPPAAAVAWLLFPAEDRAWLASGLRTLWRLSLQPRATEDTS